MYTLAEERYSEEAEPLLRQFFVSDDPYDTPFANEVDDKHILYEYWYEMESPLLDAITHVARVYKDEGFYVTILDRPSGKEQKQPYHWYIRFDDIDKYPNIVGPFQNVIYSASGLWAIMCSDEHHGLLGGRQDFINNIIALLPDITDQVDSFLDFWAKNKLVLNSDVRWLPSLLQNTYGTKKAQELLLKHGFID